MNTPRELCFRAGNPMLLVFAISRAGVAYQPAAGESVSAEIRRYEPGEVLTQVPLTPGADGELSGPIALALEPAIYFLGLHFRTASTSFRVGVTRLRVVPEGSLYQLADQQGLLVNIDQHDTILSLSFSETPATALAAQYAAQAAAAAAQALNQTLTANCAVAISGGRLVRAAADGLHYYDATQAADAYTLTGISVQAGSAGSLVELAAPGRLVTHVGWGLTAGQTYLAGADGGLVTDPAGLAFHQIVGVAISADTLNFFPQSPIFNS